MQISPRSFSIILISLQIINNSNNIANYLCPVWNAKKLQNDQYSWSSWSKTEWSIEIQFLTKIKRFRFQFLIEADRECSRAEKSASLEAKIAKNQPTMPEWEILWEIFQLSIAFEDWLADWLFFKIDGMVTHDVVQANFWCS